MNTELLPISVGIGLAVGLLFAEVFGIAAGGMIVPGYLALALSKPLDVALTLSAGLITFLMVRAISTFVIVYGRRRTVLMILIGYLLGMLIRAVPGAAAQHLELEVIGFIIPGLIAIWFDRQGVIETLAALTTASVLVRLILIAVLGVEATA